MRTTLRIDDDVLSAARSLARARGATIGEVISDLARRALRPKIPDAREMGFPVFQVSPKAPPITLEMVKQALEDE
ncbi:MAG: CopG family transcriptional regulator [Gemmatimonadota bacterium]